MHVGKSKEQHRLLLDTKLINSASWWYQGEENCLRGVFMIFISRLMMVVILIKKDQQTCAPSSDVGQRSPNPKVIIRLPEQYPVTGQLQPSFLWRKHLDCNERWEKLGRPAKHNEKVKKAKLLLWSWLALIATRTIYQSNICTCMMDWSFAPPRS